MLIKKLLIFFQMYLLSQLALAQESRPQVQKLKLVVLRITYDAFTEEEKETVNQKFYQDLAKHERVMVITETEAREKLIPLGIDPSEITSEAGYITTGQVLNVNYVLVGNMDKVGDFVEVTFRVFTMPKGSQKRYPGGKTLDLLVKEEIPNIINLIYRDIGLEEKPEETKVQPPVPKKDPAEPSPQMKPRKGLPWKLIAIGGAAGGLLTAYLVSSSGGGGPTTTQALPRPPVVP